MSKRNQDLFPFGVQVNFTKSNQRIAIYVGWNNGVHYFRFEGGKWDDGMIYAYSKEECKELGVELAQ